MIKRRFILLSIFKTWLISTFSSVAIYIIYREIQKSQIQRDMMRNCDMSALAYGIIVFWILLMSIASFTSLISLSKNFQGKIKDWLSWFLVPAALAIYFSWITVFESNIDMDGIVFFVTVNLPWFLIWGFYYSRFRNIQS